MPMPVYVEEAKAHEKWCPLNRHSEQGVGGSYNRPSDGGFSCIGAGCMMWRFGSTHVKNPHTGDMALSEDTHGYCGLAGVPGAR